VNVVDVFRLFFRRQENDETVSTVKDENLVNFSAMFSNAVRMVVKLFASRTTENFLGVGQVRKVLGLENFTHFWFRFYCRHFLAVS
jgi:hypothetical protein